MSEVVGLFRIQVEGKDVAVRSVAEINTLFKNQEEIQKRINVLAEQRKALDRSQPQYTKVTNELSALRAAQASYNKELRDGAKDFENLAKAGTGSYNEKANQLARLRKEFKELNAEAAKGDIGKALLGQVKILDSDLKKQDALLGNFQANVGNYPQIFGQIGTQLTGISGGVSGFALAGVAGLTALVSKTIQSSAELGKFKATVNDDQAFGEIINTANRLNIAVEDVVDSFIVARAQTNQSLDSSQLENLANVAAFTKKNVDQFAEAIGDAVNSEFERLKEFGIVSKTVGDQVQFTFLGQKTAVQKNTKAISEYLIGLGNLNELQGTAARIGQTLSGQYQGLQNELTQLFAAIGDSFSPILSGFVAELGKAAAGLKNVITGDEVQQLEKAKNRFNDLFEALLQTNKGSKERLELTQLLLKEYPKEVAGLDLLRGAEEDLRIAKAATNKEIDKRILLGISEKQQGDAQAKLNELTRKNAEDLIRIESRRRQGQSENTFGFGGTSVQGENIESIQNRISRRNAQISRIQQQSNQQLQDAEAAFVAQFGLTPDEFNKQEAEKARIAEKTAEDLAKADERRQRRIDEANKRRQRAKQQAESDARKAEEERIARGEKGSLADLEADLTALKTKLQREADEAGQKSIIGQILGVEKAIEQAKELEQSLRAKLSRTSAGDELEAIGSRPIRSVDSNRPISAVDRQKKDQKEILDAFIESVNERERIDIARLDSQALSEEQYQDKLFDITTNAEADRARAEVMLTQEGVDAKYAAQLRYSDAIRALRDKDLEEEERARRALRDKDLEEERARVQAVSEFISLGLDTVSQFQSLDQEIEQNRTNKRIDALEDEYGRRIELAQGNTQEQERLEEELAQKRDEINKKQVDADKEYQRRQAAISFAVGLINLASTKSSVPFPLDIPFRIAQAAALTGLYIKQVEAINSAEQGVLVDPIGILNGPSHAGGGVNISLNGRRINAEGRELVDIVEDGSRVVMNKNSTAMFGGALAKMVGRIFPGKRNLYSSMNQAGGGIAFAENGFIQPAGATTAPVVVIAKTSLDQRSIEAIGEQVRLGAEIGTSNGSTAAAERAAALEQAQSLSSR